MIRKIAGVASLATVVATLGFATTGISGAAASAEPEPAARLPAPRSRPTTAPTTCPSGRPRSARRPSTRSSPARPRWRAGVPTGPSRWPTAPRSTTPPPRPRSCHVPHRLRRRRLRPRLHGQHGRSAARRDRGAGRQRQLDLLARQLRPAALPRHVLQRAGRPERRVVPQRLPGDVERALRPPGGRLRLGQVPNAASYYQSADGAGEEDGTSMKAFLTDGATAWYDAQKNAGKTDAEITHVPVDLRPGRPLRLRRRRRLQ